MLNKVRQYINKQRLISPGDFLIVAVSGGPDSMALLHIMKELRVEMSVELAAAHLNHGLREAAGAEQEIVRQACLHWDIPLYTTNVDVRQFAQESKKSLEEAGRECRYNFFNELLLELNAHKIATAHHQDDVAETILMHLLRGSGLKGLRGILPVKGSLVRPMLTVNKTEILAYTGANAVEYAIDHSNYDTSFLRNRIRHNLIPAVQREFNPRIVETLNRLGETLREDNEALEIASRHYWEELIIRQTADYIIINKDKLQELHPAYQNRIIREALFRLKGEAGWDYQDVLKIKNLALKPGSVKKLRLKNGVTVNAVYKELHFFLQAPVEISFKYEVEVPGVIYIPEIGARYLFEVEDADKYKEESGSFTSIIQNPKSKILNSQCIYLDYDKLKQPLFIRSRQNGDRFYPPGINGSKKIKDYFIDIKLPWSERNRIPIVTGEDGIYALLGFRVSRLAAIGPGTRKILKISKM